LISGEKRAAMNNIFADLPEELVEVLAENKHVRIERIESTGHASPDGFWYDLEEPEWRIATDRRPTRYLHRQSHRHYGRRLDQGVTRENRSHHSSRRNHDPSQTISTPSPRLTVGGGTPRRVKKLSRPLKAGDSCTSNAVRFPSLADDLPKPAAFTHQPGPAISRSRSVRMIRSRTQALRAEMV